uniref:AMP-dependent synthetase/ligase domain-containing protein n=1 Tax=Kwoniella pini CBS 10737 TaxID=1296096 RepID=A0A1B9IDL9_9TREE|nr:uncharacterized protein I206_00991 [Kwoniella pini CBS 10737]OCF53685.1 hypothetical protein I206_00991 [Kwoniella pini CBS 10737]
MFRKAKTASIPLESDPSIRRSYLSPNELVTRPAGDEVTVVGDFFAYCARKYGDQIACYYRDIVDVVEETKVVPKSDGTGDEKKIWKYFTLSTPISVTYNQLNASVAALSSGLINIGFTDPSTPIASRPRVSIYADTSLNWQLMSQTFARLGHVLTTAYTTLGEEGLLTSLVEPEVELCYCGEAQLELIAKVVERAEKLRYVVYDGDENRLSQIGKVLNGRGGRTLPLQEVKQSGIDSPVKDFGFKPTENDLFCIMYTSGSTGKPKGVLLSHKNIVSSIAGATLLWGKNFNRSDLLLAYLPLTHILEQFLEFEFYFIGVPIAYGTVKTLLNDNVRNCDGDFVAYKPTLLPGVPAIYEMIRKGMVKKIHDAGSLVGTIFNIAVLGKQSLPWPFSSAIDKLLFAKVKAATGGRLRLAISGGGPLSADTQRFLSTVLVELIQGYGLTETCGMATICGPNFSPIGSVGVIGPSCEIKLQDYPDAGYLSSNKPPQGEILLRGPNVFQGYFKQEELTKESFTSDGWYKSGDIVEHRRNSQSSRQGEKPGETSEWGVSGVGKGRIFAPPNADRPIALVYPHEGNLRNRLKANGIVDDGGPKQWASNLTIVSYLIGELRDEAKKGGLRGAELIGDVILTEEEW